MCGGGGTTPQPQTPATPAPRVVEIPEAPKTKESVEGSKTKKKKGRKDLRIKRNTDVNVGTSSDSTGVNVPK